MGVGIIVVGVTMALAAAATAYAMLQRGKGNADNLGPKSNDDFKPTYAREGSVVPLIYGRVRLPGNLIWFGNITTEEIYAETKGGKGGTFGGGGGDVTGYKYFVDVWQAIGLGKLSLVNTYVNDKEKSPEANSTIFNDGTDNSYPTTPPNANKLPGVAHWYADKWYIGDNVNTLPTIHFIVDRLLETPIQYQNMTNGNNPAGIIYDLLVHGGIDSVNIDEVSFNKAAKYWKDKGYGLNLIFTNQANVGEVIESIFRYVDGILYVTCEGKYALRALDPIDTPIMEIHEEAMKDFSLNRKSWSQINNNFTGTFLDEENDFTQRVVAVSNPAAIRLAGININRSIDLKCFRDLETASKKIWEFMKSTSYPNATVKFTTDLAVANLIPGDVVRLYNSDYGIDGADFRVVMLDLNSIDKNEIKIQLEQMVETLFDDNFVEMGGSDWVDPDLDVTTLTHTALFEMPYTREFGVNRSVLLLAQREKNIETSFDVLLSDQATVDYIDTGNKTTFSLYGTLDQVYPITRTIDDEEGIYFTASNFDPEFVTISRSNLFISNRIAIIGDELIAFQQVTALGSNQYKLLGCIRGVAYTTIANHANNSDIWLVNIANNILTDIKFDTFYLKVIPRFLDKKLSPALVTAINFTLQNVAKQAQNPSRIIAERIVGNDINIQLWPITAGFPGAGVEAPNITDQAPPFEFGGDFQVEYGSTITIVSTDYFTINYVGSVNVVVKSRINGTISTGKTITVGASIGKYKS